VVTGHNGNHGRQPKQNACIFLTPLKTIFGRSNAGSVPGIGKAWQSRAVLSRPCFSAAYLVKGLVIFMVVSKSISDRLLAKIVAVAIFVGAALSAGFGQSANNSAASTYKTNCVSCHGQDGRASAVGKSLHAADFHSAQVQQQSEAQLAGVIAEGRGNMPAFGTRLNQEQINALVKYIRTLGRAK
jgi:cytochrome c553